MTLCSDKLRFHCKYADLITIYSQYDTLLYMLHRRGITLHITLSDDCNNWTEVCDNVTSLVE